MQTMLSPTAMSDTLVVQVPDRPIVGQTGLAQAAPAVSAATTDELLRELIARARSRIAPDGCALPAGRRAEERLLDVTVDGVRCALTAIHPTAADTLSPREREIARMVARGYTNKMIASVLNISLWTVSTHLRRIFLKLGVSSRAAMVALVIER
jgi:DNA-binding CsgD family transcriptional regulator